MKALSLAAALAATTVIAGCGSGAAPAATHTMAQAPTITSSIADGVVLHGAVPWVVGVRTAASTYVAEVDFSIDGRQRWTEVKVPYSFDDDGESLSTYLLGNGPHTLSESVVLTSGARTTKTEHVMVSNAGPAVPAALTGTWRRTVTKADQMAKAGQPDHSYAESSNGVWKLAIQGDGRVDISDPSGGGIVYQIAATSSGPLTAFGPANWTLPAPAANDPRYGYFCADIDEARDTFSWAVHGQNLVIGGGSTCADRDALFDGTWTRVS
jgi:hypothetical protein